ncbi:MAG: S8 family peptidase [Pseudomonadota bacterium]
MPELQFPHLFLPNAPDAIDYRNPIGGGGEFDLPPNRPRTAHADRLRQALDAAWVAAQAERGQRQAVSLPTKDGAFIELESAPGYDLRTASLEDRGAGIELLNVQDSANDAGQPVTRATLFIPNGKHVRLINKLQRYRDEETQSGRPKHQKLVESIENIRRAVVQSFWYDPIELLPAGEAREWCELWLVAKENNREDVEAQTRAVAGALGIGVQEGALHFIERSVLLVNATSDELAELLSALPYVAEFRRAKETAAFWTEMPNAEQAAWVGQLAPRLAVTPDTSVSACVIDTGVNNGHPLLAPLVAIEGCDSVDAAWGNGDDHGHGTGMCGTVAFGDRLSQHLQTDTAVEIPFRIESVKLIPRPGHHNDPRLYGERTQQAIARSTLFDPQALRVHCLAITSEDGRDQGRPSSWSGALDNAIFGIGDDQQKLCIVAAGNVADPNEWRIYPDANFTNSIHDPGQAWNALTVGAATFLDEISDPDLAHTFEPVASRGQISPYSTSSRTWATEQRWPNKPDIVLEGGNVALDQTGFATQLDDLSILTVGHRPQDALLNANFATSAAAGLATEMCARLWEAYPAAWPETIRALLVHSAQWTDAMISQLTSEAATPTDNIANLLRMCGYGVPDFTRALQSATSSLTLIAQQTIQPFEQGENSERANDMHLFRLPWPVAALDALPDNAQVTINATLSYYVEPAPGEKGWRDKYKYRSHGLDFNMKKPTESDEEFVLRLNKAVRVDDGDYGGSSLDWSIGPQKGRSHGSIHRDWITLPAVEARNCNLIGVFPRSGWWKERPHLGRLESLSRYALIVSLTTQSQDIDVYTPVAQMIEAQIDI